MTGVCSCHLPVSWYRSLLYWFHFDSVSKNFLHFLEPWLFLSSLLETRLLDLDGMLTRDKVFLAEEMCVCGQQIGAILHLHTLWPTGADTGLHGPGVRSAGASLSGGNMEIQRGDPDAFPKCLLNGPCLKAWILPLWLATLCQTPSRNGVVCENYPRRQDKKRSITSGSSKHGNCSWNVFLCSSQV